MPAPLGPMMAWIEPSATLRSTLLEGLEPAEALAHALDLEERGPAHGAACRSVTERFSRPSSPLPGASGTLSRRGRTVWPRAFLARRQRSTKPPGRKITIRTKMRPEHQAPLLADQRLHDVLEVEHEGGADHRADQRVDPADHRHDHDLARRSPIKEIGGDVGLVDDHQEAGEARVERADHEAGHLVARGRRRPYTRGASRSP